MKRFFLAVTVAVLTLEAAAQPSREPVPNVVATARPAVTIQYGGPTRAEGRSYNFTPTFFIFPAEKLDPSGAAELLEHYQSEGIAKGGEVVAQVAKYLRNNAEHIRANPPSLGTMEAENEHLYASRMKSVPCAWSVRGASDMARLRSRKFSGRELLYPTREESLSEGKRKLRQERIDEHFNKKHPRPVEYVGHGYEYPHKASTVNFRADIRYHAGLIADHKVREV